MSPADRRVPPASAGPEEAGGPWSHPPFRFLVLGQVITNLGNGLAPAALAYGIVDAGGGTSDVGFVAAGYGVAFAAALLAGGALGDLVASKARLMVQSSLARAVVQASAAGLLLAGVPIGWIVATAALNGVITALSVPSSRSITPATVPREVLGRAVRIRSLSQESARIAGIAATGALVNALGAPRVLALDALSFVVAAALFARIRVPEQARTHEPGGGPWWSFLLEGFREVGRRRWILVVTAQAALFHLAWGGVEDVLGPTRLSQLFTREGWSLVLASIGVGAVLGGMLSVAISSRRPMLLGLVALSGTAVLPAALLLSEEIVVVAAAGLVFGLLLQVYGIFLDLALQYTLPEGSLARVYSVEQFVAVVSRPGGVLLAGTLGTVLPTGLWLTGVAAVLLLTGLSAALTHSIRTLELERHA